MRYYKGHEFPTGITQDAIKARCIALAILHKCAQARSAEVLDECKAMINFAFDEYPKVFSRDYPSTRYGLVNSIRTLIIKQVLLYRDASDVGKAEQFPQLDFMRTAVNGEPEIPALTGFTLTADAPSIDVGATGTVSTDTPVPAEAVIGAVVFSVDDSTIVTIDESGVYTGVLAGTAIITATEATGPIANVTITVNAPVIVESSVDTPSTDVGSTLLVAKVRKKQTKS